MTSYGQYQDAVLNKINDLANPQTNNAVVSATTDILDATIPPTPLLCDAQGHLQVDILSGGGHPSGDASADNQTNGNQKTQVFGVDPANNQVQMSVENGGKLQVQVVGSNDINGGTPHRHLTIDANGRTLTNPLMTSTNTAINNMSDKITKGSSDVANATGLQQVLVCGKDAFGANDLKPIGMSGDRLLVEAPELANINPITANGTTSKGGIGMLGTNDGTNYRTIACDDSGHLKMTLTDIQSGIINSINVASKHDNAYLEILSSGSVSNGASITTTAHTLSAGAGSVGGKQPITLYIHFGSGTSDSNFSMEVQKSYDNSIYFVDSNFSFTPLTTDVDGNPQPAVVANGFSDGRSIKVKITNNGETNPTSVKVIIIERQ